MSRDQIKYDEVSQALSGARLGTYLRYSKNDVAGAFQLHHVNAQLAASFWEPLELFEVVLRNRLADCLTQTFGSNWPVQPVFARVITKEARSILEEGIQDAQRAKGEAVTTDDIISSLKFAFWEKILNKKLHNLIWKSTLPSRYPLFGRDAEALRMELQTATHQIRCFRNRVAHHEPIINEDLWRQYKRIHRILRYSFPGLASWLNSCQTVQQGLDQLKSVLAGLSKSL